MGLLRMDLMNMTYGQRYLASYPKADLQPAAMECVVLKATEDLPAGLDGSVDRLLEDTTYDCILFLLQIFLKINVTMRDYILVFASSRNSYLPSMFGIYGSAFKSLNRDLKANGFANYFQTFDLERMHWSRQSTDDYRCEPSEEKTNVEECINNFIQENVGCSSAIQATRRTRPQCTTMQEYKRWARWVIEIGKMNEMGIYELTGCLPPCKAFEYKMSAETKLMKKKAAANQSSLLLRIAFLTGKYEAREQYFVYNYDSFIADVGGYMGLLLGHSIYSIVCGAQDVGRSLRKFFSFRN